MKQICNDLLMAAFMGLILPWLVVNGGYLIWEEATPETEPTICETISSPWEIAVRNGGEIGQRDLERYLVGVVLAEMPASFDAEALKAQSVAARTYAAKASATGGKHGDGSVCMDPGCCQGYISEAEYLERGGTIESVDKITQAVKATAGYVLTYEDQLIEATYFSSSGGTTEDAAAVWGTEFPYLQSVSSPGETVVSHTRIFTPEEFREALGRELEGSPTGWITVTTYTEGGGVASMTIGGEVYSGTRLRSLLGLRSTAFKVETGISEIRITTEGYGHRVGMSQYGAEAMAAAGKDYKQILAHYYPGTELAIMDPDME